MLAVTRFAGDGVRNRYGAVLILQVSGLLAAAGMMLAAIAHNDSFAVAAFFVTGTRVANMVPILLSAVGNYPGIPSGAAISAVTIVGYAGILNAPASIGFVGEAIGFCVTYGALSLLLVVALPAGRTAGADGVQARQIGKEAVINSDRTVMHRGVLFGLVQVICPRQRRAKGG